MLLNEAASFGQRCLTSENMAAIYVHVDDHGILGHSPTAADELLKLVVESLVAIGFSVSQQSRALETEKAVGYSHSTNPSGLALPHKKSTPETSNDRTGEQASGRRRHHCVTCGGLALWEFALS